MISNRKTAETLRFGLFYGLFYAFLVAPISFLPIYFNDIGFSAAQIGTVSIAGNIAVMLGAPFSLQLLSNLSHRRAVRLLLALLCSLSFAGLLYLQHFLASVLCVALALFFHKALGSLADAAAVRASSANILSFDHARIGGSLGFIVALYLFGIVVEFYGSHWSVPLGLLTLVLLSLFTVMGQQEESLTQHCKEIAPTNSSLLDPVPTTRWGPNFFLLCIALALSWGSSAVMMIYLSVYLETLGWSATEVSHAWATSVAAEIVAFLFFFRMQRGLTLLALFRFSILLTTLRWVIMASTTNFWGLLFAQLFHAFSFATLYLSSMKLVFVILPDELRDRGQGWLILFGSGLGALVGKFAASYGAERLSSLRELPSLFAIAALVAFTGYLVALWIKDPEKRQTRRFFLHRLFPSPNEHKCDSVKKISG